MKEKIKETILKKLGCLWADDRSYKTRLLLAAAAMLAACFTFIFFGPFEMVAFGGTSLSYTYGDVVWVLVIAALTVLLVSSPLVALLRGKVYDLVVSSIFMITIGGYLQASLFNGSLGTLTGDMIKWNNHAFSMLLNLVFWLFVTGAVLFVLYFSRNIWKKMILYVSVLLVIMQMAPTATILLGAYDQTKVSAVQGSTLTVDGMFEYSKEGNVFVFVLDRLDYDYIEEVLDEDPAFFDKMDGFTAYTNAISTFARTQPALVHMLTGADEIAYKVPSQQYFKDAWTDGGKEILPTIKNAGYDIEMYSNLRYLFSDLEYAKKYVSNVSKNEKKINHMTALKKLVELSVYRYSPIAVKPFFEQDTNYYNEGVLKDNGEVAYGYNDSGFAPKFLEAVAEDGSKKFKFYHMFGPHAPYTMNADGTASDKTTSAKEQTMGCFNNLFAAFERMKELGIYDDATIIITGDHGAAIDDSKPLSKATRIGLFYKPGGSSGTPLVRSAAQVSNENISATIVKAVGADYKPFGRPLDEIGEDEQITRVYYKSVCPDGSSSDEYEVYKYLVTGDASLIENWKLDSVIKVSENGNFY